jgi:hypothetical protein
MSPWAFPSAAGSAMRKSSGACDPRMWWSFQPFAKAVGGSLCNSGDRRRPCDPRLRRARRYRSLRGRVKGPPSNEDEVVSPMERILCDLAENRDLLNRLRQQGMSYAREYLTWEAKADSTTQVLDWAVGRGQKPDLPPSRMARVKCVD